MKATIRKWLGTAALSLGFIFTVQAAVNGDEIVETFDDIHFWVGSGEHRCAVVVDFYGGYAWAWGYRWSGDTVPSVGEILTAIVKEDNRLTMVASQVSWGLYVEGMGYDVNDTRPVMDFSPAMFDDQDAVYGAAGDWFAGDYMYWNFLIQKGVRYSCAYEQSMYSNQGLSSTTAEDGSWYVLSLNYDYADGDGLAQPAPAFTPYGYEVMDPDDPTLFWTDSENAWFNDPTNVLGRPSAWNESQTWGMWVEPAMPVTPAVPAYGSGMLLSLEGSEPEAAYVTIKFDHDVVDDPKNPFGLDFIVFGNAGFTGAGNEMVTPTTDPDTYAFANANTFNEPGIVEVSQDGETWYRFTGSRAADDFPTLGYVYDAENPDPGLFEGNRWWGGKTDACFPVDPRVTWKSAAGLSLGEIARRFNGSAGGTGFDLRDLEGFEEMDEDERGRKWIRYVRILNGSVPNGRGGYEATSPEVDAVSDVSPVDDYTLWKLDNYGWANVWDEAVTGRDVAATNYVYTRNAEGVEVAVEGVESTNGLTNGECFALGISVGESAPDDLAVEISGFRPNVDVDGEDFHELTISSNRELTENCRLTVQGARTLGAQDWTDLQTEVMWRERDEETGSYVTIVLVPAGDERFFKLVVE